MALEEGLGAPSAPHTHTHLDGVEANLAAVNEDNPVQALFVGAG